MKAAEARRLKEQFLPQQRIVFLVPIPFGS
jgi:hypothetical protein